MGALKPNTRPLSKVSSGKTPVYERALILDTLWMLAKLKNARTAPKLLLLAAAAALPSPAALAADTWIYVTPGFSWLTTEQQSGPQAPSSFTASTIKSLGLRAGRAFGPWIVEGSADFDQFSIDALSDGAPTTLDYRGHRLNIDVLRRAFSEAGPLKITGYGRLGLGSFTMPLLEGEANAEMFRVTQTTLNVGFSAAAYVAPRTRVNASVRWMPSISTTNNTPLGRADLQGGFNLGFSGGVQYLFPSQWSLGFLAAWQTAKTSGRLAGNDGTIGSGELSSTLGSLQVQVGYQF